MLNAIPTVSALFSIGSKAHPHRLPLICHPENFRDDEGRLFTCCSHYKNFFVMGAEAKVFDTNNEELQKQQRIVPFGAISFLKCLTV
jgi:hypothetical protein